MKIRFRNDLIDGDGLTMIVLTPCVWVGWDGSWMVGFDWLVFGVNIRI
jgi:hypothetical protein